MAADRTGNTYVVARSFTERGSGYDFETIKYSPTGEKLWERQYSALASPRNEPVGLSLAPDGSIYVVGNSRADASIETVKYDPSGNVLWARNLPSLFPRFVEAHGLTADADGGVYIIGETAAQPSWVIFNLDYLFLHYSRDGDLTGMGSYDGPGQVHDVAYAVATDSLGNAYVTGAADSADNSATNFGRSPVAPNMATIKCGPDCQPVWIRTYDGPADKGAGGTAIWVSPGGDAHVTGYSFTGDGALATIKYDTNGQQVWAAEYPGPTGRGYTGISITGDTLGRVYVTGQSARYSTAPSGKDIVTVSYDPDGAQLWDRRYAGPGSMDYFVRSIAVDRTGNAYVTGWGSDGWSADSVTLKYSPAGEQQWEIHDDPPGNAPDYPVALAVDPSGGLTVVGTWWSLTGSEWWNDIDVAITHYTTTPPASIQITQVRMVSNHELGIWTTRQFGDQSYPVTFSFTLNHTDEVSETRTLSTHINTNARSEATVFDLETVTVHHANGDAGTKVQRFRENQLFEVHASVGAPDGSEIAQDKRPAAILLPIVLIPGVTNQFHISPDAPHFFGGDGTFPELEAFMEEHSAEELEAMGFLGEGYRLGSNDPYPTLSTLSYDRDNASFQSAALILRNHITAVKEQTYADCVNVITHSKGGLVARQMLSFVPDTAPTVHRLIMTLPPNLGSLWALADGADVDYYNLRAIWPWFRYVPYQNFFVPPLPKRPDLDNPELWDLNQKPLPTGPKYSIFYSRRYPTPITFTALPKIKEIDGEPVPLPDIGWGSGDSVVPDFSQLGRAYNPNKPDDPAPLIPAFVPVDPTMERKEIGGYHGEYLIHNQPVFDALFDRVFTQDL